MEWAKLNKRMLNFHTYKRLFCANCDVITKEKGSPLRALNNSWKKKNL